MNGCSTNEIPDDWSLLEHVFGEYARVPRSRLLPTGAAPEGLDVIHMDGRFRDGCLLQALAPGMLKKPEYGMLLFDNSERT
jgi:hypothetical protein